jgi:CRP-like cAMP-binding protein/predicted MFS family arabinose efflux permease
VSDGPSYRGALRNRDFRLLAGALTQSMMGDWAYNVALVVYVYEHTHSAAWVAAATLGRMVPRFLASPYGGVIAERFERVHVMVTADLIRFVLMGLMTVVTALHGPAWLAITLGGVIAVVSCVYEPATAAMVPQMLGEDDLAAGNAVTEGINNVAIIAGPGIGAVVLALGSTPLVMGLDSLTFLISAAMLTRMHARSTPTDVTRDGGALKQMTIGLRAITSSSTASLLVAFPFFTTFLYGVDTVLFVYLSRDKLGTGANGYGYLLVALGVGGVIATTFVNRLAGQPRLSAVLCLGMVAFNLPMLPMIWVHSPAAGFALQVVRGVATLVVDVLAVTALQRSLAPELISRVFGVMWAIVIGGLALGAFITPVLLNTVGLNTTIALDALVVPALAVLAYPKLASLDSLASAQTSALAPRIRLLESLEIFAAAPRPVIERLARASEEVLVEPGATVLREGDAADALFVLVDGDLVVSARGEKSRSRRIRTMSAPGYVGEIGLLQGVPRTATVKALTAARLWRIDGDTFLSALTETTLSPSFVSGMTMRLQRTHPSRQITIPEQRSVSVETAQPEPVL